MNWNPRIAAPYFVDGSSELMEKIGTGIRRGLTISAPGFYGPQGRQLRLEIQDPDINEKIRDFRFENKCITNYEMESSALFGLSALLGHKAATVCVIIANRYAKQYSKDYHPAIEKLIEIVLNRLAD
jgi:uridine phosphorylase